MSPYGIAARRILCRALKGPGNTLEASYRLSDLPCLISPPISGCLGPDASRSYTDNAVHQYQALSTPRAIGDRSGDDYSVEEASSDDELFERSVVPSSGEGKSRRSGKTKVDYARIFPNLSTKLRQIFKQGGSDFAVFFEPMALEVTTKADLYALLDYRKEGQRLIQASCRSAALNVSHEKNKGEFQEIRPPELRPYRRYKGDL